MFPLGLLSSTSDAAFGAVTGAVTSDSGDALVVAPLVASVAGSSAFAVPRVADVAGYSAVGVPSGAPVGESIGAAGAVASLVAKVDPAVKPKHRDAEFKYLVV